ncbi:hypothetical protein J3R30DRAFT_563299 [Lentinula aciculospora]|uniref:F-box domain-containing protein n=1 Tax=Lentinula aciculospora TaxID=153920 RepID=A0A9W9A6D8_9AGAR|nr:hypothetical protein J3R30DRAFT_563299 [Lentinula aciculospora]
MSIHTLPTEILLKIFHLCFCSTEKPPVLPDPYGKHSSTSTHIHASASAFPPPHVCSLWRDTCSGSPKFYPTLSLQYTYEDKDIKDIIPVSPLSRLCVFLELTAPHPISVEFKITTSDLYEGNYLYDWYGSEEKVLAIGHASGLVHLLKHCTRWRSATISIPYPLIPLFFPEETTFPRLRKLDLQISTSSSDGSDEKVGSLSRRLFGPASAPNLQVIVLEQRVSRDTVLPWRSSAGIRNIQVIILFDIYLKPEDMRAFSECQNLHTIHFNSCTVLPSEDPTLPTPFHTLLPKVTHISSSRILPSRYVRSTPLSFLTLPQLRSLQIQWNEGIEVEVMEFCERSSFSLEKLTLIQVQRGVYRPPTEQFLGLLTHLSGVDSINQSLIELELNHTDAKWDVDEFREVMEVLSLGRKISSSEDVAGPGPDEDAGDDQSTSAHDNSNMFPFLKQFTIAGYMLPDNTAFVSMIRSRCLHQHASMPSVAEQGLGITPIKSLLRGGGGLEILRLRCPKSTLTLETLAYFETLVNKGLELYYDPWVGSSSRNLTIWRFPSYECILHFSRHTIYAAWTGAPSTKFRKEECTGKSI